MAKQLTDESGRATLVLSFLIADVRGYTRFTAERGDAAAALLAKRFADLARDAVEARGGRVIELRGDEALAVFESPSQAVRAAIEFQATCAEESEADPAFPLPVGVGIDSGEAVPVEDGYRGVALNTAARLCSNAGAGQVLVTRAIVGSTEAADAGITFVEQGPASFKGFDQAVDVIEAVASQASVAPPRVSPALERTKDQERGIPAELDPLTPLVDREHEMRWLRGTWRMVRRGGGRMLFVSGPSQIGKTRLAGEIAAHVHADGGAICYAGPGGAATAMALSAIRGARQASTPTLLILDDVDVTGPQVAEELEASLEVLSGRPVLVLGLLRDRTAVADLARLVERADERGDGHRGLARLDIDGVRGIVRLYVGQDETDAPVESMARASHGVPGRVHEVVSEWARSEASRRLAAAAEFLAAGRDRHASDLEFANNVIGLKLGRLYSVEGRDVLAVETCPYKGLAAFERDDSAHFFGRERLVGELAARTVQVGLLGVVGASGSGKSSVIGAGLLPSLAAGLLPGSEIWKQVAVRPGEHPMNALRAALSSEAEDPIEEVVEGLSPEGRLVLVIDQFEETFTLCAGEAERSDFVEALTGAAKRWPENVAVILAIRADYYGHCAPYPDLAEALAANHVLVGPLKREELKRAIELPARRAGLRVESALADALVEEVSDEPGGLPLLSTALVELWQTREDGWIRMEAHEQTGGVRGAVSRLAETSYEQLSPAEQKAARRVFLRLVASGEGETVTRRRVELDEFDPVRDPDAAAVLTRLTQDRLLTKTEDTVEVAHEALLREWPRLRAWLEEDVQGHQLRQHLTHAAQQWEETGREAFEVYRGARLSAALDWAATRGPDLNEQERDFLSESRQASEREADRQRRTNRRLRGLLAGTAVLLVVALVAGGLALVQRGRARDEAVRAEKQVRIATARELAAAAVANLDVDPERSILLALAAVEATWKADRTVVAAAEEALHRSLEESRVVLAVPQGGGVAISDDGKRFATTGEDGTPSVWATHTGRRLLTLRGHKGGVNGIAYSPDGSLLATAGDDRTVRLWDAASGRQVHVLRGHRKLVLGVAFSPDGSLLATSSRDGTVRIWDVATGTQHLVLMGPPGEVFYSPPGPSFTPAFSPDGSRVASGGWKRTPIWDLSTGKISMALPRQKWEAFAVAFSPDGSGVATDVNLDVKTWDAQTGKPITTLSGLIADVNSIAYSPDGTRIAGGGSDATAQVWDAETGRSLLTLGGHTIGVDQVAFTADGDRLLTGGMDGTARVWDISPTGGSDGLTVSGPVDRQLGVSFSPDGTSFAVPRQLTGVTIRDVETGARIITLKGHDSTIRRMVFSLDGNRLVGAAGSALGDFKVKTVPVWDVSTGELVMTLTGHSWSTTAVAVSPDGRRLATSSLDKTIRLWDAFSGKELGTVDAESPAWGLAFSPDGRWLVSSDDKDYSLIVWDANTLERRGNLRGHTDAIQDLAFAPDGKVVTGSWDGTAKIWDLESGRVLETLRGHTSTVMGVAVSPDGTLVATGSLDGTAKLWDLATGREILTLFGHDSIVNAVAFSPDSRLLATGSADGTVALHLLRIDDLRDFARERVTRTLTDEECRQYLHVGKCPAGI
jgi:WD40 repeat protein/class 3 adenylate cyclase